MPTAYADDVIDGELTVREEPAETVLGTLARAETDLQIATAKRYPRSIKRFLDEAQQLVTLNEEVAGECMYALPRGGKTIEGPSARFAEVILSAWGNSHGAARVIGEDDKFVTAQAVVWDLERNVRIAFEVRRRITGKNGKRYDDDMIGVTGNAAASIAFRNAVLKVVPKAFWNQLYGEAKRVAIGDAKTLDARRATTMAAFAKMGVREPQILALLERQGIEDIGLDDLAVLRGCFTAIRDEGASIESVFNVAAEGTRVAKSAVAPKAAPAATSAKAAAKPAAKAKPPVETFIDAIRSAESEQAVTTAVLAAKAAEKAGKLGPEDGDAIWEAAQARRAELLDAPPDELFPED